MTDDTNDAPQPATPRSVERSELAARLRARADALRGPLESERVATAMPEVQPAQPASRVGAAPDTAELELDVPEADIEPDEPVAVVEPDAIEPDPDQPEAAETGLDELGEFDEPDDATPGAEGDDDASPVAVGPTAPRTMHLFDETAEYGAWVRQNAPRPPEPDQQELERQSRRSLFQGDDSSVAEDSRARGRAGHRLDVDRPSSTDAAVADLTPAELARITEPSLDADDTGRTEVPIDPDPDPGPGTYLGPDDQDAGIPETFGSDQSEVRYPSTARPLVITLVVVVALALIAGVAITLARGGDDDPNVTTQPDPTTSRPRDEVVADGLDEDDIVRETTPLAADLVDLELVDSGVTVVDARFEGAGREGAYAVIVQNPNATKVAKNVAVTVTLLDADGDEVDATELYVEAILPRQEVAVASLLFDVPESDIVSATATFEVASWVDLADDEAGAFTFEVVETRPEVFGGFVTSFTVTSSFERALEDVGVTVVYRAADGTILGGANDFIERVDPDTPTPGEVKFFVNVDEDEVATTELYATVGFGFFG